MNRLLHIAILIIITAVVFSCRKETFNTSPDAGLIRSLTEISFDTLFTSTGSTTRLFKIINPHDQKINISNIRLEGGNTSAYKININGFAQTEKSNIELAANDSIYVFVIVSINPSTANLPFIVRDSIRLQYNGRTEFIRLKAWGQNANFIPSQKITGNKVWSNNLPYVITGPLTIDSNAVLTIEKGVRIFVSPNAPIFVDGTLRVLGEKFDSTRIVFQGDRLDGDFKNFPGTWPGIIFRGFSRDNLMEYAVIKNAVQAIKVENPSPNTSEKLSLRECIIDNASDAGILAINTSITARNLLVSNCGSNLRIEKGGSYNFTHCTLASIGNSFVKHNLPVAQLSNFIVENSITERADLNALFTNCIFWGENGLAEDEFTTSKNGTTQFNITLQNCLYKVKNDPASVTINNSIKNVNPTFERISISEGIFNFRLKTGSAAINKGAVTGVSLDLDGNMRTGVPDIGCYENQ